MPRTERERQTLTARNVFTLAAPETGEVVYWDALLPGFGLRVRASGARAFMAQYRVRPSRRLVKRTYGSPENVDLAVARGQARAEIERAHAGADPQTEFKAKRNARTMSELGTMFLVDPPHDLSTQTRYNYEKANRYLERFRTPARDLDPDIVSDELQRIAKEVARRGKDPANMRAAGVAKRGAKQTGVATAVQVWTFGRLVGRWAVRKVDREAGRGRLLDRNVWDAVTSPGFVAPRQVFLVDPEIVAFWKATAPEPDYPAKLRGLQLLDAARPQVVHARGLIARLWLLLSPRRTELVRMRVPDLELDTRKGTGLWKIPAHDRKYQKPHVLPLAALAVTLLSEYLERWPAGEDGRVFPTSFRNTDQAETAWLDPTRALSEAFGGRYWTPHDLRRTAATGLARTGTPRPRISRILSHASREGAAVTEIYDLYDRMPEMTADLARWDRFIAKLVGTPRRGAEVMELRRG